MSLSSVYTGGDSVVDVLTEDDRRRYGELADVLVPSAEGMPSATQAEVHTHWVDQALQARPDLGVGLRRALELTGGLPAEAAVEMLNAQHSPVFDALGTVTAGAYFLNPDVRQALGYPGQVPQPIVDDVDTYADLLEHVLDRGPIYREVSPATPGQAG
ncbi:hypothetical protein [Geodermatophilus sp. DSM 44513]|uniref:hypothetical protein n=1 Tax=Geodermatophilus sp. DSM 44513 TaxID=1528104 RepID=UPI001274E6E1|nr:hypothetical protein [Geodermatophilus sp. DSM 44513]WNV75073.1 hypothetical protein RTG05_19095 [Geodermatophilus sp. DSM 44513]